MDRKLKFVKLERYKEVIIFPCSLEHSAFKHLNPISAGFCYVLGDEEVVRCFGESFSLGLEADIQKDTLDATRQVFGIDAMLKLM